MFDTSTGSLNVRVNCSPDAIESSSVTFAATAGLVAAFAGAVASTVISEDTVEMFPAVSTAYTTYTSSAKPVVSRFAAALAVALTLSPLAVPAAVSRLATDLVVPFETRYKDPFSSLVAETVSPGLTGPVLTPDRVGGVLSLFSPNLSWFSVEPTPYVRLSPHKAFHQ